MEIENVGTNPADNCGEELLNLQTSKVQEKKNDVHMLDRVFRYLAPLVYVIFCISYFGYYLTKQENKTRDSFNE